MSILERCDQGVIIRVKAVPGARCDQIVGRLGDRLKIRVAAPPEAGKANRAIAGLLAKALNLRAREVTIVAGHASSEKSFVAVGVDLDSTAAALGLSSD